MKKFSLFALCVGLLGSQFGVAFAAERKQETDEVVAWNSLDRMADTVTPQDFMPFVKEKWGSLTVFKAPKGTSLKQFMRDLKTSGAYQHVEPNIMCEPCVLPSDPGFAQQWFHHQISSPRAWDISRGAGVTIAIVDTGIDLNHPEFAGRLVPGYNAASNQLQIMGGDVSDVWSTGHGTQVAGVAAAGMNNGGIVGVAPAASLMPIRVTNSPSQGPSIGVLINGARQAIDMGAKIVNISWTGVDGNGYWTGADSGGLPGALDEYARQHGAFVVWAAGNQGRQMSTVLPNILVVSGTDATDHLASFSNFGKTIDLAAPAVDILTTKKGGGYITSSGTSLAAPMVCGALACILSSPDVQTVRDADYRLLASCADVEGSCIDIKTGYGRLNVGKAIAWPKVRYATQEFNIPYMSNAILAEDGAFIGTFELDPSSWDLYLRIHVWKDGQSNFIHLPEYSGGFILSKRENENGSFCIQLYRTNQPSEIWVANRTGLLYRLPDLDLPTNYPWYRYGYDVNKAGDVVICAVRDTSGSWPIIDDLAWNFIYRRSTNTLSRIYPPEGMIGFPYDPRWIDGQDYLASFKWGDESGEYLLAYNSLTGSNTLTNWTTGVLFGVTKYGEGVSYENSQVRIAGNPDGVPTIDPVKAGLCNRFGESIYQEGGLLNYATSYPRGAFLRGYQAEPVDLRDIDDSPNQLFAGVVPNHPEWTELRTINSSNWIYGTNWYPAGMFMQGSSFIAKPTSQMSANVEFSSGEDPITVGAIPPVVAVTFTDENGVPIPGVQPRQTLNLNATTMVTDAVPLPSQVTGKFRVLMECNASATPSLPNAGYLSKLYPPLDQAAMPPDAASSIGAIELIVGDIDSNNEIGPGDFALLAAAFGSTQGDSTFDARCDIDGDEEVGPGDFAILAENFGLQGDAL